MHRLGVAGGYNHAGMYTSGQCGCNNNNEQPLVLIEPVAFDLTNCTVALIERWSVYRFY